MPGRIKILCVDDEVNVLKALRRTFMEEEDYQIYQAQSGAEGLEILESVEGISMVISDYRMPGMTGVEFLRQVNERWPDTVRIVLSGYADTAVVVEAVNLGHIYKFIPKPWDDSELLINISAALEHQKLRRENSALNIKLKQSYEELKIKNAELQKLNEHLEDMVEQRTRALQVSQSILDVLPFAVFGIDIEGYIAHGNNYGCSIFTRVEFGPLGHRCQDVFPEEITAMIDRLIATVQPQATKVTIDATTYCCQAYPLAEEISRGIVLILSPVVAAETSGMCYAAEIIRKSCTRMNKKM